MGQNFNRSEPSLKDIVRGQLKINLEVGKKLLATDRIMESINSNDEDINYNTSMSTPATPFLAPSDAPSPQVPASSSSGPITRARARDLNFVMLLKNEGPEE
jgi:hypothetical protein